MSFISFIRWVCALVVSVAAPLCFAFQPASGMWWNPNEDGKGYNFEFQNDTVFITLYTYDANGKSKFNTAIGQLNGNTKSVIARLYEVEGGSCLGCPNIKPTSRDIGEIRIAWTDAGNAAITLPNNLVIPIKPLNFGYASGLASMQGTWAMVYAIGNTLYAEQYNCAGAVTSDNLVLCRSTSGRDAAVGADNRYPGAAILFDVNSAGQRVNTFIVYQFGDRISAGYVASNGQQFPSQGWQTGTVKGNTINGKSLLYASPETKANEKIEESKREALKQASGRPVAATMMDAIETLTRKLELRLLRETF